MSVLVTGGAGYIGSATVELLRQQGEQVVVVDSLARGHAGAVDPGIPLYKGDVGDRKLIAQVTSEHEIDACIHFAAYAYVGESVQAPAKYFVNNVEKGIALLDGLLAAGVTKIVFSSTCSTYGEPITTPIVESHPQRPENPYGWSKFFMERILESYDKAYGLRFVALRYFNACGAIPARGESHDPETHLIPLILHVAQGKRPFVSVFGSDYPTPDGTAVRDYIHIADLGSAHFLALKYLRENDRSDAFNLGNGKGYSVLEVVEMVRQVTGCSIPVQMEARRPGDPSVLIADASRAQDILGWQIQYPALEDIVRSAWAWHQSHPEGYARKPKVD